MVMTAGKIIPVPCLRRRSQQNTLAHLLQYLDFRSARMLSSSMSGKTKFVRVNQYKTLTPKQAATIYIADFIS